MNGEKRVFERVYICLQQSKVGFKACRQLIGLDGCFLKGYCKGVLLAAVGIDAENSMFLVAYAVVQKENTDTWTWFCTLIKEDFPELLIRRYTFMSDRQKGLENALGDVFDGAEIRHCVRHLHSNFRSQFPGLEMKQLLWRYAKSTTPEMFTKVMEEMKNVNVAAYEWLLGKIPSEWTKEHFQVINRCNMLTNNLCESFNAIILNGRDKPIISMLEVIRHWLMGRIYEKRVSVEKWKYPVAPRIQRVIEKNKEVARWCGSTRAGSFLFEVEYHENDVIETFSVDLEHMMCTCRGYQFSGIPCGHALTAIWNHNMNVYDYIHDYYKRDAFIAQYRVSVQPMPSPDKWPHAGECLIYPPIQTAMPGRPKRKRNRKNDEPLNSTKARRTGQVNTCKNCGQRGHKRQTCKNPTVTPPIKVKKMGRPPKINPKPETVKRDGRRKRQKVRDANHTQASTSSLPPTTCQPTPSQASNL